MNAQSIKILFVPDVHYSTDPLMARWVMAFSKFLHDEGTEVDVLARQPSQHPLHTELETLNFRVIGAQDYGDESLDETGVTARFRARQVISLGTHHESDYDIVLTQGIELSRYVAGNGSLQSMHWALIDDDPVDPQDIQFADLKTLKAISSSCKLMLTSSPRVRRQLDSKVPEATSKTRLLPVPQIGGLTASTEKKDEPPTFFLDYSRSAELLGCVSFDEIAHYWKQEKFPPRLVLSSYPSDPGEADIELLKKAKLHEVPGFVAESSHLLSSHFLNSSSSVLIPDGMDQYDKHVLETFAGSAGITVSRLSRNGAISDTGSSEDSLSSDITFSTYFKYDTPDYGSVPHNGRRTRVVLAGADFKFAGDIVDTLLQRDDIDLRVDLFEANAKPQPQKSQPYLDWADVVIAEFASKNAIWYSHNIAPHQKLIVHLHGYELLQDWIDELRVDNCYAIVVASEFYRNQTLEMKDWPEDKVVVIPNSVNPADIQRPKHDDARFHIGIVGIVPILKRPDRALDLLEGLLEHDDRFILHIKGHSPWNYVWEWKKAAHQDSYREFYGRIGRSPDLASHVVFEPFSPDMGNWLTKIGWILSPSTRETFHLSAIEGATSGAVPVAWRRPGSEEIIGSAHNVDSTDEAVAKILSCTSLEEFDIASRLAREHSKRYSVLTVRDQWLSLIFKADAARTAKGTDVALAGLTSSESELIQQVESALRDNDPESALSILDENIPLTAAANGPLKDLELYVRGIAAVDEKRFTQFLSVSEPPVKSESVVIVKPTGASNSTVNMSAIEDIVIDVDPPRYLRLAGRYTPLNTTDDVLSDHGTTRISLSSDLRIDRWIQAIKASIQQELRFTHHSLTLLAQGPWWIALPVAMAADELSLRYVWLIDGSDDALQQMALLQDTTENTNFVAQVIRSAMERADLRIAASDSLVNHKSQYWLFDAVITDQPTAPAELPALNADNLGSYIRDTPSRRFSTLQVDFPQDLDSLAVGFIGSDELRHELASIVDEVREVSVENWEQSITADLDVIVVDESANDSGAWKGKLESSDPNSVTTVARVFDRARLLGASSVYLHRTNDAIDRQLMATARKADTIVASWLPSVSTVLSLHPISITRVGLWLDDALVAARWALVFRSAGIRVKQAVTIPVSKQIEDSPLEVESAPDSEAKLEPLPQIDVYLDLRNSPVDPASLEDLANQTLGAEFVNLFVVGEFKDSIGRSVGPYVATPSDSIGMDSLSRGNSWLVISPQDSLGKNYLLSLWLSVAEGTIVTDISNQSELQKPQPYGVVFPANYVSLLFNNETPTTHVIEGAVDASRSVRAASI